MKLILLFTSLLLSFSFFGQTTRTIGFYNVENLFDTIDQANDDNEFLPTAASKWTPNRYQEKLRKLNQAMDSMGNLLLLGVCEIENKGVLEDLNRASSKRKNFGIVHYDSPDARGIDVGIIYDSSILNLAQSGIIRFNLSNPEHPFTRDILWAKFVYKKDTIIAMINHWPSRRGGQVESEPNRLQAAIEAREFIDSVGFASPKSMIVFMGDLNDYPEDMAPKMIQAKLTPLISKESGKYGGSYNYRGEWDVLDHMMVSKNAFKGKSLRVNKNSGHIYSNDFLTTEYQGNIVPKRNYAGTKYLDGYSDHLPVSLEVVLK